MAYTMYDTLIVQKAAAGRQMAKSIIIFRAHHNAEGMAVFLRGFSRAVRVWDSHCSSRRTIRSSV
jgi:hypothetical protein